MAAFLLLLTILASLYSSSAHCGFPGHPLNGFAAVPVNKSHQVLDISNWTRYLLDTVLYQCYSDHVLIHSEREHYRKCVNGKWTGQIPQCAFREELKGVTKAVNYNKLSENDRLGTLVVTSYGYWVELDQWKRLSGVLMEHDSKSRQNVSYNFFVVDGIENAHEWRNVPAHQINGKNYTILTLANRHEFVSKLGFRPSSGHGETKEISIARAELLTLSDNCGHPEIPINGHVKWMTNDLTASYSCDKGYRLNSKSQVRHCLQGSWDGSEPICIRDRKDYVGVMTTQRIKVVEGTTTTATTATATTTAAATTTTATTATATTAATTTATTFATTFTTTRGKCGQPKPLNNSDMEWNGTSVTYICYEGHKLTSNSSTMRCVDGKWTGPIPTCERTIDASTVLSGAKENGSMLAIIVGTCCGLLIIVVIVALIYEKRKSGRGLMQANFIPVKPKKAGGNESKRIEIGRPKITEV